MVLRFYFLRRIWYWDFYSSEEVLIAYSEGVADLHAPITTKALVDGEDGELVWILLVVQRWTII